MNVFSTTNAGKRRFGQNHWFWAVWMDVEQTPYSTPETQREYRPYYLEWNKADPTASGFCSSKKEARHAAWTAIKSLSPGRLNANERGWASRFLWAQQANDKRPLLSRCKVSKDNWLWVVYESFHSWYNDDNPIAHGFATSPELAHEHAEAAVGSVVESSNRLAEHFRQKQAALKRSQRPASTSGTTALEFVYQCYSYSCEMDNSLEVSITAHRIVKKTKKRLYVEHEPAREDKYTTGDWRDFVVGTFILDREEFEATGKAERRGRWRWHNTFYADPAIYHAERRSTAYRPECFVGLEVPAGASPDEIQSAYRRLAKKTHPDSGGDAEAFKRVQEYYEHAMRLVSAG